PPRSRLFPYTTLFRSPDENQCRTRLMWSSSQGKERNEALRSLEQLDGALKALSGVGALRGTTTIHGPARASGYPKQGRPCQPLATVIETHPPRTLTSGLFCHARR